MTAALTAILLLAGCVSAPAASVPPVATTAAPPVSPSPSPSPSSPSVSTAERVAAVASAAQTFAWALSDAEREQLSHAYDDDIRTTTWSNLPVAFSERTGVDLSTLTEEQHAAAMAVLEALLSEHGYATVTAIMGGDRYLRENSPGANATLGTYYVAFFGDPSPTEPWALQVGGHHLGFNATLAGAQEAITLAPTHLGSQPIIYPNADGTDIGPLLPTYEAAFAFFDALADDQRAAMYRGEEVEQLVCAPAQECSFPTGEGIAGAQLDQAQRELLLNVIAQWVRLADDATAATTLARIESSLDDTWVTWSGATAFDMNSGAGVSFRITGPDVHIELANQPDSIGADVEGYLTAGWGHVHTIYRDPRSDYGSGVAQR